MVERGVKWEAQVMNLSVYAESHFLSTYHKNRRLKPHGLIAKLGSSDAFAALQMWLV
jgi:hypothetical protein